MANAIKKISVQRGHDVSRYVLTTFGGAGGQHACGVADALGMTQVFAHPLAGVLSAYGMGLADQTAMREAAIEAVLSDASLPALNAALDRWPTTRSARCSSRAWRPSASPPSGACTCATRAPIRRSTCRPAASPRCSRRSRPRTGSALPS
jgi:N-methylhydantoinase A/oxoprolinase/acetone carboxylase beta subunit